MIVDPRLKLYHNYSNNYALERRALCFLNCRIFRFANDFICSQDAPGDVMNTLKLKTIGTSTGLVIPKDMLARLNVSKGDTLYFTEAEDGGYYVSAANPDFAAKMQAAENIMRRYRNTLSVLAK